MSLMSATEIVRLAVRIEENGSRAYRRMAGQLKDARARDLFIYLAQEDDKHRDTFRTMLERLAKQGDVAEGYPGEYSEYMKAYAENIIFARQRLSRELTRVKDTVSALEFAIARELDSILYYQEVKRFLDRSERSVIDAIIEEERSHFLKLGELKRLICRRGRKQQGAKGER